MDEELDAPTPSADAAGVTRQASVVSLGDATAESDERLATGYEELDRVLGGGVVRGSVILLGGDPGIGKSTLLLQVSDRWLADGRSAAYVAGEESPAQLALRASRLGLNCRALPIVSEQQVEAVLATLETLRPDLVIVDSVQTLQSAASTSPPGSVSQLREVTARLVAFAKQNNVAMVLVGHVTRTGAIAGPRVVEHLVDTVLYLEGDPASPLRVVRGVKNRFGSTLEVGLLEMAQDGLRDGSAALEPASGSGGQRAAGVAVSSLLEGTRAFVLEIQALVSTAVYGPPRLYTSGIETGRVQMLAAVLERHAGDSVQGADLYLNVVGGLKLSEPSCDLAVCLAMASSLRQRALPPDLWVVGEVGLTGELRPVGGLEARMAAAHRAGYRRWIVPGATPPRVPAGVDIFAAERLAQVIERAFD